MLSNELLTTLLCWPNSQQHLFFVSWQMASFTARDCTLFDNLDFIIVEFIQRNGGVELSQWYLTSGTCRRFFVSRYKPSMACSMRTLRAMNLWQWRWWSSWRWNNCVTIRHQWRSRGWPSHHRGWHSFAFTFGFVLPWIRRHHLVITVVTPPLFCSRFVLWFRGRRRWVFGQLRRGGHSQYINDYPQVQL